jgi:hypothetical protein
MGGSGDGKKRILFRSDTGRVLLNAGMFKEMSVVVEDTNRVSFTAFVGGMVK